VTFQEYRLENWLSVLCCSITAFLKRKEESGNKKNGLHSQVLQKVLIKVDNDLDQILKEAV